MKKPLILLSFLLLISLCKAQVLFTFGGRPVTEKEFLYSFNRNNTDTGNTKKAMQDYLDLYVKYKLKVQAAKDLRMDTLANQRADLKGFEEQLKPLYLLDQPSLDSLVRQAYERSRYEIKVNHIFFTKEKVAARERSEKVMADLKAGKNFNELAVSVSDDEDVRRNKGLLGNITAFTLPYAFESAIYDLKDGEFSNSVESSAGYHIFNRISSKAIISKRSYKHILVATPEGIQGSQKTQYALRADSIYKKAIAGISFDSLAMMYSDDRSTVALGGFMDEIPAGKYESAFEEQANALKNKGDISPVFSTSFGFHILQVAEEQMLNKDFKSAEEEWKNLVMQDERKEIAAKEMIRKSIGKNGLIATTADKETYIAKRLALFSPQYAALVNDFRDGNLLFEIMDKKVWGKASSDLEGLKKFHASRKDKYQWQSSVYAYTFTFQQKEDAESARKAYNSGMDINALKKIYADNGFADSGRYEAGELLGVGTANAKEGFVSDIHSNISDGSSSFHIITKKFNDPSIKSFDEAKAAVINDYQQYLEDAWILSLRKKYPVVINAVNWKKLMDRTL